ncbi:hypothetical protein BDFB_008038 [Asbolus verrucosus]|uniref:Uncharacterized protein n=1 Tax=Asbolus verrucosus TaxID=1661398 RepID=A0A482VKE3_ASBVE|nr:hypothetical protein BDFB_008038 [Asbolus verrucosus]
MFNVTGNRNAENLLKQLNNCNFDAVLFVTNNAGKCNTSDELLEKCQQHKQLWLKLELQDDNKWKTDICEIFPTVSEAIQFLTNQDKYDLLVTGSIHLIGSVLSILDPDLNEDS